VTNVRLTILGCSGSIPGPNTAASGYLLEADGFVLGLELGNGTLALLTHPEQRAKLMADPGLLDGAVEELLRYDGPVEFGTWRFTTEPITVGGVRIPAGEPVLVVLAAADRDPARFADPETLDLTRNATGHLALGHGIHFCLGAPLARLEMETGYVNLARRFADLRLTIPVAEVPWAYRLTAAGPACLPVTW